MNSTSTRPPFPLTCKTLQEAFATSRSPIQSLVVTQDDPRLIRRLTHLQSEPSTVVLPVATDSWDRMDEDLTIPIRWALQKPGLDHLLLMGSSMACRTDRNRDDHPQRPSHSGKRLTDCKSHNRRLQSARERFMNQTRQLLSLPEVVQRQSTGQLNLHLLFYLAESGVFQRLSLPQESQNHVSH